MIILDKALAQREAEARPIRIGLVGAGFMGRGITLQLCTPLVGMQLVAIANRHLDGAQRAWTEAA
jgi:predicted homoserine dehydrogenase-like protein